MLYTAAENEEISLFDVISLYPTQNRKKQPVGHPIVIRDFTNVNQHWTKKTDNPYKGIIKCLCLPKKDKYLPIIPMRVNERLIFANCRSCAANCRKINNFTRQTCKHNDLERAFVTTITHRELNLALERGYQVLKLIEVWHYEKFDDKLFKNYMSEFLRIKIEASG